MQEEQDPEKKQRIKLWMGACLVLVAGFVDLLQALLTLVAIGLILNPIISIGANFLFWLWFKLLDVQFIGSPKNLAVFFTEALLEEIPAADAFPILTVGIITIVLLTRAEDSGGLIGKAAKLTEGVAGSKLRNVK